jgi:cephalosporin-C deacetylase-like acetyl esterase
MMRKKILYFLLLATVGANAQPAEKIIKVAVSPDHADWTYRIGEKPRFNISITRNNEPVKDIKVWYEIGPEKMAPLVVDSGVFAAGSMAVEGPAMKVPGFLRCTARVRWEGKEYVSLATAGFEPDHLRPTVEEPTDFDAFWNNAKAANAKIALDVKMTLLPERCTDKVNVYHVSMQHFGPGYHEYGVLCVPKKEGKYPAVLKVPAAGARAYGGDIALAEQGVITFEAGIHGVSVIMDPSVYADMIRTTISNYWNTNLDDRDNYYYKRVYLGCVRAIDLIYSLSSFDGSNLAVSGVSQGGALAIITAALDNRVKWLVSFFPALCDQTGYLHGRAGGWPHLFAPANQAYNNKKDKIATSAYYDVVNFAKRVKAPGFYSWGYNDETCPPTSMFTAYDQIKAMKELFLVPETGHWNYPEQASKANDWLLQKLKH